MTGLNGGRKSRRGKHPSDPAAAARRAVPDVHVHAGDPAGVRSRVSPPHMWNYHLPGFITASLLHEGEYEVTDRLLWQMRELDVPDFASGEREPWWGGAEHFQNYSRLQADAVVRYLLFIRDHGSESPHFWEWEPRDERMLGRWLHSYSATP